MATLGAVIITGGPGSGKTKEVVARLAFGSNREDA